MASSDNNSTERLLTLREAAALVKCSVKTLRRRNKAGELPMIRDGRIVRIHPNDLENYILKRRSGGK